MCWKADSGYGFHAPNPDHHPQSQLPQKQLFYQYRILPDLADHQPSKLLHDWFVRRLPYMLLANLPQTLLAALLPAALLSAFGKRKWILAATVPLFFILYIPSPFFPGYYPIVAAPAMALLLLLGAGALAAAWPTWQTSLEFMLVLAIGGLTIASLPEVIWRGPDESVPAKLAPIVNRWIADQGGRQAILLFQFAPTHKADEEPVYNADVAWPDDAQIIRAHDLRSRNIELFHYYAQRQPGRAVYLFDESDGSIRFLGSVAELARGASTRPAGNP